MKFPDLFISDQEILAGSGALHCVPVSRATFTISQAGNMAFWRVPLDAQEIQVTKGLVHIIDDRCKGCGYCIEFCPKDILRFSDAYNRRGYHPPVVVRPDECVNCHYCEIICPEFAIYSVEIPPTTVTS